MFHLIERLSADSTRDISSSDSVVLVGGAGSCSHVTCRGRIILYCMHWRSRTIERERERAERRDEKLCAVCVDCRQSAVCGCGCSGCHVAHSLPATR